MQLPNDFLIRMKNMLGDQFENFLVTFDSDIHYTGLRLNSQKGNLKELFSDIIADSDRVLWCEDGFYCTKDAISGKHPYHVAGLCYFQEPSAMSCVEALEIMPDDFILDLCAAPGGKSTQAGAKLSEKGLLVANEIIPKRAAILAENIERFGFSNAIVTNENPEKLAEKFPHFFDKIIVDAPCSGEGMFRKEPQAIMQWSTNHTISCAERQKHIMDCAYEMLSDGGYIAYSTCTFAPCENEGVIDYMLNKYPDLKLVPTGLDMLSCGNGDWVNSKHDLSLTRRIFPHLHKGEGHFIALLKKSGTRPPRVTNRIPTDKTIKNAVELYKDFEEKNLNVKFDGCFKLFGDNLYLIPHGIDIDKLKITRAGLHLGVIKKNRFEPSHALALALKYSDFKQTISFDCNSNELVEYLRGSVITSDLIGYTAVCVENFPIGWAKGSNGVLKNHFPKCLRQF